MEALKQYPGQPEIHVTPEMPVPPRRSRAQALFAPELVWPAVKEAFVMLRPTCSGATRSCSSWKSVRC